LLANIGHAQSRKDGAIEPALITVGDDLNTVAQFLAPGCRSYGAASVVKKLMSLCPSAQAEPDLEAAAFAPAPELAPAT
jgi:nitronate monooxygenase